MSFFAILFLFFLGYFVIWPLTKFFFRVNHVRRQMRDTFAQAQGFSRWQTSEPDPRDQRKDGWTNPPIRKKKIDPSVGEYVEFKDIQTTEVRENPDGTASATYEREQQVVDVKWEDVK